MKEKDFGFIYGLRPALEIVKSDKREVKCLYLDKSRADAQDIINAAKKKNIPVKFEEKSFFERVSRGGHHQGVAVEAGPVKTADFGEALSRAKKTSLWLAFDEITDPQNLGAMLRSAACLGVDAVILPKHRTVGITPTVERAACGAIETVEIIEVVNLNQTIIELKEKGFWIYGADMGGKAITQISYSKPMMLVIGSEGRGLREKTAEHCDELISIPQKGGVESLNASCACSIILYDILSKTSR
ncbi:MAG: 23S rRNA (guanosine(2251)-2'-O)-methyltransferase RlmB [Elusimicrobia bacterium]|nr:23S rRNA (guanosine(2251)-2'-O)-methyltransferase RlmB [Elusimicrobiota bacterium]